MSATKIQKAKLREQLLAELGGRPVTESAANEVAPDAPGPPLRRREEVLAAAARLFFEQGYAATSTTDIARELGMHRGSIYYYLSTKEDLLYELIEQRYTSGRELLERWAIATATL